MNIFEKENFKSNPPQTDKSKTLNYVAMANNFDNSIKGRYVESMDLTMPNWWAFDLCIKVKENKDRRGIE